MERVACCDCGEKYWAKYLFECLGGGQWLCIECLEASEAKHGCE